MRINTTNQTFTGLRLEEAEELFREMERLILTGDRNISSVVKEMFDKWCEALNFKEENQKLILLSSEFPQRALLSLIYLYRSQLGDSNL